MSRTPLLAFLLCLFPVFADDEPSEMVPDQETSIRKGLTWLVQIQNQDGLWGCEKSGAPSTAITGLAVLAFLSSGSTIDEGPYAPNIRRAVQRLLAIQTRAGQITRFDSTGMGIFYDHSCATLALAEVYGTRRDAPEFDDLRDAIHQALRYIYTVQNDDGGWGPQGRGSRSDLAITCSVWMAVRAAHNAGFAIERANARKVEKFVKECSLPEGGFTSVPSMDRDAGRMFYPTSAGLRILYGMGRGNSDEVERGTAALLTMQLGQDYGGQISEWDYCGAFYAVQAMMHESGAGWKKWWPKIRDHLVKLQNDDGSWTIEYCLCCRAYATALSVIVLQAPKRLLPLFQL